jgi:hypothetical protein
VPRCPGATLDWLGSVWLGIQGAPAVMCALPRPALPCPALLTCVPCPALLQVLVLHTGRMVPERLQPASRILADALRRPGPQPGPQQAGRQADAATGSTAASPAATAAVGGGLAAAMAMAQQPAAAAGAAGVADAGGNRSVLVSLHLAEQLVQEVGGHMHITYPINMVNAETGMLDVSTAVEIWLPGAR